MADLPRSVWGLVGDAHDPLLLVERLERSGERPVLVVTGEVCLATGTALEDAVERYLDAYGAPVPLDLRAVAFMDAAGLSSIIRCIKRGGADTLLEIVAVSLPVSRLMELTSTTALVALRPRSTGAPG